MIGAVRFGMRLGATGFGMEGICRRRYIHVIGKHIPVFYGLQIPPMPNPRTFWEGMGVKLRGFEWGVIMCFCLD